MKILVCGGRDFDDWGRFTEVMESHLPEETIDLVIQGGAKGADFLAKVWAKYENIPCDEYPADWQAHGKRAGHIRNQEMLDKGRPDWVIAFPGGRGTADMIQRAERAGVPVRDVSQEKET